MFLWRASQQSRKLSGISRTILNENFLFLDTIVIQKSLELTKIIIQELIAPNGLTNEHYNLINKKSK